MRKIIIVFLLFLIPVASFAGTAQASVPEPETLFLLGIGALAFITSRLIKK